MNMYIIQWIPGTRQIRKECYHPRFISSFKWRKANVGKDRVIDYIRNISIKNRRNISVPLTINWFHLGALWPASMRQGMKFQPPDFYNRQSRKSYSSTVITETGQLSCAVRASFSELFGMGSWWTSAKPSSAIWNTCGQTSAHCPQEMQPSRSIFAFMICVSFPEW